jgi:hypothetical protein
MGRKVSQEVVAEGEFLNFVLELIDDLDWNLCYPLVAQVDRVQLGEGVRARGGRKCTVVRRRPGRRYGGRQRVCICCGRTGFGGTASLVVGGIRGVRPVRSRRRRRPE